MVEYPRVLFVTPVAFNPFSGGGATFSSLFKNWPKDRLATVHNDPAPTSQDVCERYFKLGPDELDFFPPLNKLRRRTQMEGPPLAKTGLAPARTNPRPRWIDFTRELILGDSIPEQSRLTPALEQWIADFRPELLYTILGSNGMMALIERIRARFNLPVVVHIMDDWPTAAHWQGLFAPIERPRMKRLLEKIFDTANACLGISPAMCRAYSQRYGREFIAFQYALDLERWSNVTKHGLSPATPSKFLYVGSIFRNAQLDSLVDCAQAIAELNREGFPAELRIVTSDDNCARYQNLLKLHTNISVEAAGAGDDDFFQSLADADVLLLPVNFDKPSVDFIRYSMPTKVPAYLNSGTPILAYGPAETAQIGYAIDKGWALAVSERSLARLKSAMKNIVTDPALRKALSEVARKSTANHDARLVRNDFQKLLCRSALQMSKPVIAGQNA